MYSLFKCLPKQTAELEHGGEHGEGYAVVVDLADLLGLRDGDVLVAPRLRDGLGEVVHLEILKGKRKIKKICKCSCTEKKFVLNL